MDIIEHYIKNSSLVEIPKDFKKLIGEAKMTMADLFKRDNKQVLIDKLESGTLIVDDESMVKVSDKQLWNKMKDQLNKAKSGDDLASWQGGSGDFKTLTGYALGKVEKELNGFSNSSGGPSGEDWEAMIVVGVAMNDKKNPAKECASEWERVEKKWVDPYIEQALKLAKEFKSAGLIPVSQSGTSKGTLSKDWDKWRDIGGGKKNKTAKTDLEGGGKKISLKKAGGSQAMSAKNGEAIATFYAACDIMGENSSSEVNSIIDTLRDGVMTMDDDTDPYKGEIGALEKDLKKLDSNGGKGFSSEKIQKLKVWKDRLDAGRKDGAAVTSKMNSLFLSNSDFKNAFVFEASSGSRKFGDSSVARADYLVEFDADSGVIKSQYSMKDESDQIKKLASMFKFYMSFKSSGNSAPYMALRGNLEMNPSKVIAWMKKRVVSESVTGYDFCPTFDTIIKEAFDKFGEVDSVLSENISSYELLTEWEKFINFKKFVSDKIKKGVEVFKNISKSAFEKFKKMWEWIKARLLAAFDWIKKQGRKALEFLLKFFGIELTRCGADGPFELFTE